MPTDYIIINYHIDFLWYETNVARSVLVNSTEYIVHIYMTFKLYIKLSDFLKNKTSVYINCSFIFIRASNVYYS